MDAWYREQADYEFNSRYDQYDGLRQDAADFLASEAAYDALEDARYNEAHPVVPVEPPAPVEPDGLPF
jgi:hypothetical protein